MYYPEVNLHGNFKESVPVISCGGRGAGLRRSRTITLCEKKKKKVQLNSCYARGLKLAHNDANETITSQQPVCFLSHHSSMRNIIPCQLNLAQLLMGLIIIPECIVSMT